MSTATYNIRKNGRTEGPFTLAQMRAMWMAGSITGDMPCELAMSNQWQPLALMAPLLEAPEAAPAKAGILTRSPGSLTVIGWLGCFLFWTMGLAAFLALPMSGNVIVELVLFFAGSLFSFLGVICYLRARRERAGSAGMMSLWLLAPLMVLAAVIGVFARHAQQEVVARREAEQAAQARRNAVNQVMAEETERNRVFWERYRSE